MTNVKLKLMFSLLNALLTADIVHARPYADSNTTDLVIKFTDKSDTFNLPVDPNSDTLIVANEESETTGVDTLDNVENKPTEDFNELDIRNDYESENKLNISSTLLDDIIDAETSRDERITDIFFRSESEFAEDLPRFEFLIAGKVNESDFNRSVNSDNGVDRNSTDVMKKMDYVELVEVVKASKENRSAFTANITGHEVDNDLAPDTILSVFSGFTDLQTLFLACFATLLPLLAVLFASLLIRCLCRRYCPLFCSKPTGSTVSESSEKQDGHQQLKTTDNGTTPGAVEGGDAPAANGSIFTMTLKNNHLIVETEERNDITRNGRETKMKYSPDNDGIFVVEVQQSTAYRPSKSLQNSPPHDPQISTNQALIHRIPEELEKKIIEEDSERSSEQFDREKALALSSTGLSISDLSMSSIGSHNVSYSYGSQLGYEQGPFGYPVYTGYEITKDDISGPIPYNNSREPLISKTPTDPDKPVVTAAIFKQDSIICSDLQAPGYCIEGSTDGPLLSDVQAREVSLQHLQDQRDKKIENGVAVAVAETPKRNLNRADSLPVRLEEGNAEQEQPKPNMDVIIENDVPSKDMLKSKRASLPTIRAEVYASVKDHVSAEIAEEDQTDECGDSMFASPPMITITEESESSKSDGTS